MRLGRRRKRELESLKHLYWEVAACDFTMTDNPHVSCQDNSVECRLLVSDMYTPCHSLRLINQGATM